ncbi:MAG: tRNA (adenosine(37)-N6)-dimethylallyltransferase MiaA [Planctomycetes bacterium]|nr:tRNA (adenosine(37)-N6)-dimethylallyltransferase MiaA [Planctomycetota bacterium]
MADPIHALIGPTASGKESFALAVAPLLGAEILSLDSMKVYREMDIGTAKASNAARAAVPHHLLDLADPADDFTTRRWLSAAEQALSLVRARSRLPLFVGGTALYLKALLHGLFEGPAAQPSIRARLHAMPVEERFALLARIDPLSAARLHPNDARRVVRALEIFEVTGNPASSLRREWESATPPARAVLLGIRRPRPELYARIDQRVARMVGAGLVEEVRALLARPGGVGSTARQALGYKEVADFLEGRSPSLEEALRVLRTRTRNFARRQLTWFKRFPIRWIDVGADETPVRVAPRIVAQLRADEPPGTNRT